MKMDCLNLKFGFSLLQNNKKVFQFVDVNGFND